MLRSRFCGGMRSCRVGVRIQPELGAATLGKLLPCAYRVVWGIEWRGLFAVLETSRACGTNVLAHAKFHAMMEWNKRVSHR